jgi:hypothetical protein
MKKFTLAFSLLLAGVSGAFAETPTVGTADAPAYYTIGSYNRGGYLTEQDAPISGWYATSSLAHSELTESSLWEVYSTDAEDGSVYIKNHATGNYLFTTGPVNVTETATPVWILENGVNDSGFAISLTSSTADKQCIDADNYDTLCGTWAPVADDWVGTTWVFTAYDSAEAFTTYLAKYPALTILNGGIDTLEAYKTSVPASKYVVEAAIDEINGIEDFSDLEALQTQVDAIVADAESAILRTAIYKLTEGSGIINNRRASNDKPGYLYSLVTNTTTTTVDEETEEETTEVTTTITANTEETLTPKGIWKAIAASDSTYYIYNPITNSFLGNINDIADYDLPLGGADAAGEYAIELCNGYVTFKDVNAVNDDEIYYLNIDSRESNLTNWAQVDGGSYWILADIETSEETVTVTFNGATVDDDGNNVAEDFSSFTINIPEGAEPTGLGNVTLYKDKDREPLKTWSIDSFSGSTTWSLTPFWTPSEEAAYYYVIVDGNFFMKDGKYLDTAFADVTVGDPSAEQPSAEGFELAVTPAAGLIDSLTDIVIAGANTEIGINWGLSDLVITLSHNGATLKEYAFNTVNAGDMWPDAAAYKLEANYTEGGTYTLAIPAGAFLDETGDNKSAETTVVWNIAEDSINSITVTSNGKTTVYDLSGRRVATPAKGFYIVNGQKTILK